MRELREDVVDMIARIYTMISDMGKDISDLKNRVQKIERNMK